MSFVLAAVVSMIMMTTAQAFFWKQSDLILEVEVFQEMIHFNNYHHIAPGLEIDQTAIVAGFGRRHRCLLDSLDACQKVLHHFLVFAIFHTPCICCILYFLYLINHIS